MAETRVELLIENDQTVRHAAALQAFFDAADRAGVPLGMTFDMGNWQASARCRPRRRSATACAMCIARRRLTHKWVAVPLGDSVAPWRAVLRALPADVPHATTAATRAQIDLHPRRARATRTTAMTEPTAFDVALFGEAMLLLVADRPVRWKTRSRSTSAPPAPRPTWPSACRAWA